MKSSVTTVAELLKYRAHRHSNRIAYTWLHAGDSEASHITWGEVDARAESIATWLRDHGAHRQRVLLLLTQGIEYVVAFYGCMYAGATVVPSYPVVEAKWDRTCGRLKSILAEAKPRIAVTDSQTYRLIDRMSLRGDSIDSPRWVTIAELEGARAEPPALDDMNTTAVIQYTSGSTSVPKGVVLTHRNILANMAMIKQAHCYDENHTVVGWIPLAHDWGLFNNVVQAAYSGMHSVLMDPSAFLEKPVRWLAAISRYRNVTSGAPPFAYELCVQKIPRDEYLRLDLSRWVCAGVSAGPIRVEALERFVRAFKPAGFTPDSFYTAYGLAEATLLVSASTRGRYPRVLNVDRRAFETRGRVQEPLSREEVRQCVSCGLPAEGQRVVILDRATHSTCQPMQVGEICVAGQNVTSGYWERPDETSGTFVKCVVDGEAETLLRTGDLGFQYDNELFVTGRMKDVIVIRGRNIYSHDVEAAVEGSHGMLRRGCCAAFGLESVDEERLVVVHEVREPCFVYEEVVMAIRRAVMRMHDIAPYAVVLVSPGGVLKTSSGKVRRHACKAEYLNHALPIRYEHTLGQGFATSAN